MDGLSNPCIFLPSFQTLIFSHFVTNSLPQKRNLFYLFRGTCEKCLSSHSLTDIWTQTGLGTNKVIPKNVAYLSMVSSMLFVLFCFLRRKKKRRKLDKYWTISGKKGKKSRKDLTRYLIETFGPAAEGPLEMISV